MSATTTPAGFEKLLAVLDTNREKAGEKYELIRRKLVKLFEWRGARDPEGLADETMDRVAKKLAEGTEVTTEDPVRFFQGTARFVFLESLRNPRRNEVPFPESTPAQPRDDFSSMEKLRGCLDRCLAKLPASSHRLVLGYYQGDRSAKIENRKKLAASEGLSAEALRLKVHRLREKLEACVSTCVDKKP